MDALSQLIHEAMVQDDLIIQELKSGIWAALQTARMKEVIAGKVEELVADSLENMDRLDIGPAIAPLITEVLKSMLKGE